MRLSLFPLLLSSSLLCVLSLPLDTTSVSLDPTSSSFDPTHPSQLFPRYVVQCLEDQYHAPMRINDCYQAAHLLFCRPNTATSMLFARNPSDPSTQFKVPYSWITGTCAITVDIDSGHDNVILEDTSRLSAVGSRALEIIRTCVEHGTQKGGSSTTGEHDRLSVVVRGKVKLEEEDDEEWKHCLGRNTILPHPDIGTIHYT